MSATTRSQIPAEVNNFYVRTLLDRAVALFVHNRFAQIRDVPLDIPQNSGTGTVKFRRYANLAASTTPLGEGVTPAGKQLSVSNITADVAQYGDFIELTDVVQFESQDAVLMEAAEILGDQAGDTLDILTRNVLAAGTNVQYANEKVSRVTVAAADKITAIEVKKMVRVLKKNKARPVTRQVNASTGYATDPVAAAYIAIVSPDTTYDLEDLDGFTPVEKYSSQAGVMEGEVGKIKQVRFVETTNAKIFAGAGAAGIDVHATIVLGQNAYGVTRISGKALEFIVKATGSAGTADPLNQRGTSGWKATHVAKILNDTFMGRIEHAVSE